MSRAKDPKIINESQKIFSYLKIVGKIIAAVILVAIIIMAIGEYKSKKTAQFFYKPRTHAKPIPSPIKPEPEIEEISEWHLKRQGCNGEVEKESRVRNLVITESKITLEYKVSSLSEWGSVTVESPDGENFSGQYEWSGDTGEIFLKKISSTRYEGEWRDKRRTGKIILARS